MHRVPLEGCFMGLDKMLLDQPSCKDREVEAPVG